MKAKNLIVFLVAIVFCLPTFAQNTGKKPLRTKAELRTDYYRIDWVNASGGTIIIGDNNLPSNAKSQNDRFKSTDIIWWKNNQQAIRVHNTNSREKERLTRGEMAKYETKSIYDYYVKKHKLAAKGGENDANTVLNDVELYMINDTVQIDLHPIDVMVKDENHYFTLLYLDESSDKIIPLTTVIDDCLYLTKNDLMSHDISTVTSPIKFYNLEYHADNSSKQIINSIKINILR